ncbi:MAG: hypothetical protein HY951_07120 [Bacteroidia bacterium]|nr:hypothetical protein [Bacteroidia bacterium]
MKVLIRLISVTLFLSVISCKLFSQQVLVVSNPDSANFKAYITSVDSLADIIVMNVETPEDANSDGFLFPVINSTEAQLKVFFTSNENESDIKFLYTTNESLVGWRTNNKRYLFKSAQ